MNKLKQQSMQVADARYLTDVIEDGFEKTQSMITENANKISASIFETTTNVFKDDSSLLISSFQYIENSGVSLNDTYIPNGYSFSNAQNNYDLLNFINSFANNDLSHYESLSLLERDARTVIIRGYQGIGKSSLLAKISYDYYNNKYLADNNVFFTNFRKICDSSFSIEIINKNKTSLTPILFIDALDESGLTEFESVNRLNDLTDELASYGCKVIVTCRHGFINANDIRLSLEITLQPFSYSQAVEWLTKYKSQNPSFDKNRIENSLQRLNKDKEIRDVILIPYIFYTCIEKNIDFTGVTGLGKLYDMLFDGVNARSAITSYKYSKEPRHNTRSWKLYEEKIGKLAISFCHADNHTISENKLLEILGDNTLPTPQLATEFYLSRFGTSYRFIHNSLFEYFVAKKIVYHVSSLMATSDIDSFFCDMSDIIGDAKSITLSVLEFVSHFITNNKYDIEGINEAMTSVLKNWTKVYHSFSESDSVFHILETVQNRFVVIMNVLLEYLKKHTTKSNSLQMLTKAEVSLFVKYTRFNERAFDFIKWFNLTELDLRNINLRGTNMAGQLLNGLQMINADLRNMRFTGGYLRKVDFSNSDMRESDFKNADLQEAVLTGADLRKSRLSGANLYNADLMFADLRGAHLLKTDLRGVNFLNCKITVEQLEFIHLDIVERYNINVYQDDKLLKFRTVVEYYKEKFQMRFVFNYAKTYNLYDYKQNETNNDENTIKREQ